MKKIDIEQLEYDMMDLKNSVHMMMLGFDNLENAEASSCLSLIEKRLEDFLNVLDRSEKDY